MRARARARIAHEQAVDALTARAVVLHPAGFGVLDPMVLVTADPETAVRLLSRVVLCLGGLRYPARRVRLARLCSALSEEPPQAHTLGGCRFVPWRGRLLVLRELAAAEAPVLLEPGVERLWDRRFAVSLSPEAEGAVMFGYLGQRSGAAPRGDFDHKLPPLVRSVLTALWDKNGVAAVPHLGYFRPGLVAPAKLSFRPFRPLTPPGFTVV